MAEERLTFWEQLGRIDRRWIYLLLCIVVIVPLIFPLKLMRDVSPRAKEIFHAIDTLQYLGKPLMISVDFDPASEAELRPILRSMIRHAFARNTKVLLLGMWPNGIGLGQEELERVAREFNQESGKGYVFLGYKPGMDAVILGMGENIQAVFPIDGYGVALSTMPMMQTIKKLKDVGFIVSLSAGTPGYTDWLLYAGSRYKAKIGAGTTAVQAADAYPFLQSGQLTGLLAGMKGAAEYEFMNNQQGISKERMVAVPAMDPQSLAHLAIIAMVILGNIGFLASLSKRRTS
jgi:hypothetical protein